VKFYATGGKIKAAAKTAAKSCMQIF